MASLLFNLVNNLVEGIHKIKCKYGQDNKKRETCGIIYTECECSLEYTDVKDDLIEYVCLCPKKNYQKKFKENLKKQAANADKYFNHAVNKVILLLEKGVYPYKNMDDWEKFNVQ